jgi:hypothetical protein
MMQRAIYKGEVYEQYVIRGVTVMRRPSNSYVNVTQLLVAAGLNRNQRRNLLKRRDFPTTKDVISGGSLQGTWIPADLAAQYAAAHGVADEFRALFDDSFVDEPSAISGYEYVDSNDSVSDCDDEEVEQEPSQTSNEWVGTYAAAHGVADEFRALFDDSFVDEPSAISGYEYVDSNDSASDCDDEEVEQEPSQTSNEWVGTLVEANRSPFEYARLVKVYEESSRLYQTAWAISNAHLGSFGYLERGKSEMQSSETIVTEILLNFRRGCGLSFRHDEFVEGRKVRDSLVKQIHALTGKEPRIEIHDDLGLFPDEFEQSPK